MKLEDFTPGHFIVVCGVIGAAADGEDYIHSVAKGRYATAEDAREAIEADKRYWAGDNGMGGLMPRDRNVRRYRIFQATEYREVL